MQTEFESENLDVTPALRQYVEEKLGKISRRWDDRITRVRVFLKDTNSTKGGVDKQCTMEARLAGIDPVVAETTAGDAYEAVDLNVDKLIRALEHATKSRRHGG